MNPRPEAGLLNAANCAVVLVDHQARLMPAMAGGPAALDNALRLARLAHALGVPCLATEQVPEKLGTLAGDIRPLCTSVMAKTHFDACGDGLLELMRPWREAGRDQWLLAGCESHVCLLQTALGLAGAGVQVWVVRDACASRTPANHEAAMHRLAAAGLPLVSTEMVGFEWVRHAGHPHFKTLQSLVK